jgi:hypothetical protein
MNSEIVSRTGMRGQSNPTDTVRYSVVASGEFVRVTTSMKIRVFQISAIFPAGNHGSFHTPYDTVLYSSNLARYSTVKSTVPNMVRMYRIRSALRSTVRTYRYRCDGKREKKCIPVKRHLPSPPTSRSPYSLLNSTGSRTF